METKQQKYDRIHPERRRKSTGDYTKRAREAALMILGKKCVRCKIDDIRCLQIDHIEGGGKREITSLGGAAYYNRVIRSATEKEKKYQLLCANCNWIKRWEGKEATGRPRLLKELTKKN